MRVQGPISNAVGGSGGLGWSNDDEIALLANWGPICYFIAVLPASWLLDVKGLRTTVVSTAVLVAAGAGIRLIPGPKYLIHAGQFLNGLAGPVAMSSPPVVSSTFFPPQQRTVATVGAPPRAAPSPAPLSRPARLRWPSATTLALR